MNLEELGYTEELDKLRLATFPGDFETARVIAEHKERYAVMTSDSEYEAEITGNMRFTAKSREDFPAVGDWVLIAAYDSGNAIIHHILPRFSVIKRQAVAQFGEIQIIAANIDFAFLVQAADRDFNINRLERYLTICNASKVKPVIVLTKTDLSGIARTSEITESIKERIKNIPVIPLSNETLSGYDDLNRIIEKGKTYCLLGSSGVGKSTLLNNLCGRQIMKTESISHSTNKGRHVTSHRELIILDNGGILIDNPGMRDVGIADAAGGLEITFDMIYMLSEKCRYKDCKHINEAGCAVVAAVRKGELDNASYENYLKLEKEKAYFESTVSERKERDRQFGKMMKNYKKSEKYKKP
jgi:ribosome biogenesis GTPase / thiamine phosphate phosphatase